MTLPTLPDFTTTVMSHRAEVITIRKTLRKRIPWLGMDHVACMLDAVDRGRLTMALPAMNKRQRGIVFSTDMVTEYDADVLYAEHEERLTDYLSTRSAEFAPYEKLFGMNAREKFALTLAVNTWRTLFSGSLTEEKTAEALLVPYATPQALFRMVQINQMNRESDANALFINEPNKRTRDYITDAVLVRLPKGERISVDKTPVTKIPETIGSLEIGDINDDSE